MTTAEHICILNPYLHVKLVRDNYIYMYPYMWYVAVSVRSSM